MAGVFTVLGLGILLTLGFWQVERLAWKESLLAKIEANMAAEPLLITDLVLNDLAGQEYRAVCAKGHFLHQKELYVLGSSTQGLGGILIYTPLETESGVLLINRGWVPNEKKAPKDRLMGQIQGEVTICGPLRLDRIEGWVTPENNPEENRWFTPKVEQMAEALKLNEVYPFFVEANETPNPGGFPKGGQTFLNIPNNHLGYAFTWFGLALTLIGVFGFYAYRRIKKSRP